MTEKDFFEKREKELLEDITIFEGYIKDFWEVLPAPVCITTPIFSILETGAAFNRFFGYDKDEILGGFLDILFQETGDFKEFSDTLSKEKRIFNFEASLKTKKGKKELVLISAIARQDDKGEVVGYVFSFVDITQRRKMEAELKDKVKELELRTKDLEDARSALMNILEDVQKERQRAEYERDITKAIVSSLADGLLLLEQERIILVNSKAREIFDLTEQDIAEIQQKPVGKITEGAPLHALAKLLKKQDMDFRKAELALADKTILEVSAVPILKGTEETGRMIILHDVTREKFIEQMKTEFVSIAAHQLRTPISAIKWILRMLIEGDMGRVSVSQKDYLEKAYQSNERMIRLINDLLNVTRIEEGKFLYDVKKEDIVKVIERALKPFEAVAERKAIGFEFKVAQKEFPRIYLDASKMTLAVQNLVDNAVRYTEKGKVLVAVDFQEDEEKIIVKVADTGIGIPKDQHRRVFSRFFRASNAIKTETSGTGLGLFIAKNIIEAHQGAIWFESEMGKGTTFYFALPLDNQKEIKEFVEKL